jgi:hypothetical protein
MLSVFPFFPFADSRLLKRAVTQRSHLLQLFHCQLEPSVDLHRGLGPFVPAKDAGRWAVLLTGSGSAGSRLQTFLAPLRPETIPRARARGMVRKEQAVGHPTLANSKFQIPGSKLATLILWGRSPLEMWGNFTWARSGPTNGPGLGRLPLPLPCRGRDARPRARGAD